MNCRDFPVIRTTERWGVNLLCFGAAHAEAIAFPHLTNPLCADRTVNACQYQRGISAINFRAPSQRGAALIVALWALAILSLLMATVVSTLRLENKQSAFELQRSHALIGAESGIALVVEKLLSPNAEKSDADGHEYSQDLDGMQLTLSVRSERGKLDMNFADVESISKLVRYLGASQAQAELLTNNLKARRASGSLMTVIEQLQTLPGVDSALYERLLPDVTIWSSLGTPDPAYATNDIRAALQLQADAPSSYPGFLIDVHSRATLVTGVSAEIDAVLFLRPSGDTAQLYRVLRWQE